jgi:hypothetical protein
VASIFLPPSAPMCRGHGSPDWILAMKTERFVGHHEARGALMLSLAGVTAITLIGNLILMILY